MATQYGYRRPATGKNYFDGWSRAYTEQFCQAHNFILIAREVSEPRILSIRA